MTRLHANECKAMKIDLARADVARLINQAEYRHHLINGRKMELSMYSIGGFHSDRINGADRLLHCSQFSLVVFNLSRGSEYGPGYGLECSHKLAGTPCVFFVCSNKSSSFHFVVKKV